ncbi:helicase [Nocardiopsis kunsanensis]|uniref:Helicase n=1 Tax=Nocardiopsis kunsanensis TaxID=141693 RepID=A0A918XA09_9ACTN|nr:DEAD/DEAH box helicase [Nocardiopsis kunsanensis]GHD20570.1 helicase [Nocardiopsis kunsanensis]
MAKSEGRAVAEDEDRASSGQFAPGARVVVRDAEWMVRTCTRTDNDGYLLRVVGVSEFVRGEEAHFFTGIEHIEPLLPEETTLVHDASSGYAESRLYLESVLRRTPLPQSERRLATAGGFLLDDKVYQRRPAELALKALRPRVLLADVVGLGKTLEIGLTLAELIRRGRGERILVVTPQQVLEQFQQELWTRFAIPLVRLDSVGLERIQREIPAGRNPFLFFKRAIISIDTLKNQGKYGQHLRNMHWDAVVIDESHNLINEGNLRNKLARVLAQHTDALLLASATPHNGDARSFAQLINLLDPAAIADPGNYTAQQIEHLYIRRTKVHPEVRADIGDQWPERGPSVPVRVAATPAEEAVSAELTQVWLAGEAREGGPVVAKNNRLFPYTLLKAFLSSHRALAATVGNRLKVLERKHATAPAADPALDREHAALTELGRLADKIDTSSSAKFQGLLTQLADIGIGKKSPTRAVVFSESVPTLEWLREELPAALGLKKDQVALMHGGMSDTEQQRVIADFALSDSKVRVLVTGDVASEGVNLHRQCHHIVHYDLPWSLIRIEQRNGRIDRYGQEHQPQFRALILTSTVDGAKDDTTVAEKLLGKEADAHRSLGTAEAETGLYSAKKEEDRLVLDLLEGRTVEESLEASRAEEDTDPWEPDAFFGDFGVDEDTAPPEVAPSPGLFADTEQFVLTALDTVAPELDLGQDETILAFAPPADLQQRLKALPAGYLKDHKVEERLRVTFDREHAEDRLNEARSTKTTWPDTGYVTDLHPLVEWLVDKVQVRTSRGRAHVLVGEVDEPVFLVQGTYSNALGQPTVVEWMAVTGLPGRARVEDMFEALERAGVGPGMVNTGQGGDLAALQALVPDAVRAATAHLEQRRDEYASRIEADLAEPERRVADWEQLALDGLQESKQDQRARVRETAEEQRRLLEKMRTAGEPLLRVLAVVKGANRA